MKHILENNQIYVNQALQNFILGLEERYTIEDAQSNYSNLVNYMDNVGAPYHQWLRYREGFAGKLIEELIQMSGAQKGEMIIDPFCGSGTTPVVAVLNGYNGLGIDINPMSAFITNVKTQRYTEKDIENIRFLIKNIPGDETPPKRISRLDVKRYFESHIFYGLLNIKEYIDNVECDKSRSLLVTAFLCIIEDCSNRRREGNGLKTVMTKINNAKEAFVAKVNEILYDVELIKPSMDVCGYGVSDSAFFLQNIFNEHSNHGNIKAGAVIFSPPYANSFDYFESYKLELVMGGFVNNISEIGDLRKRAVRSFIGVSKQDVSDDFIDSIAREIEESIPNKEKESGKKDTRTRKVPNMIRGYFGDMQEIIRQCGLCLDSGRKTYIVVDQSSYLGKLVPTDLLLAYLSESVGFNVGRIIICRKARTSAQQLKKHPYLKDALRGSIVELVKK